MSDVGVNRELITLKSEQKLNEMALKGHQTMIANMLNGSMGKDMKEVLSGKKKVKLSPWRKIRYKFLYYLKMLTNNGVQVGNSEYNGIGKSDF